MASPRLLTFVALCTFGFVVGGCALGPIWARAIEGQVTDAETGQPVAGAHVFASYVCSSSLDPSHENYAFRWATTDSEGRFAISGRPATRFWAIGCISRWNPDVAVLDRRYGIHSKWFSGSGPPPDWHHVVFEIRRDSKEIEDLDSAKDLYPLCSNHTVDCYRACELWYGEQECSRLRARSGR
jgi:hypothetical protein